jgi:hypothetical protein
MIQETSKQNPAQGAEAPEAGRENLTYHSPDEADQPRRMVNSFTV